MRAIHYLDCEGVEGDGGDGPSLGVLCVHRQHVRPTRAQTGHVERRVVRVLYEPKSPCMTSIRINVVSLCITDVASIPDIGLTCSMIDMMSFRTG